MRLPTINYGDSERIDSYLKKNDPNKENNMASLEEAFQIRMAQQNVIIPPIIHDDNITSTIKAGSDMGHFTLHNDNGTLITNTGLYKVIMEDITEQYSDIGCCFYFRKHRDESKSYIFNDHTITVDFKSIPCVE